MSLTFNLGHLQQGGISGFVVCAVVLRPVFSAVGFVQLTLKLLKQGSLTANFSQYCVFISLCIVPCVF